MREYYSNTISELIDSGFDYLYKQIDDNRYTFINEVNKNIIETSGIILIFEKYCNSSNRHRSLYKQTY